ncbi:hypothetical protein GLYMA_10G279950v4 [Glycine max]|nr:hypothetical protein GLYMA_10G279950v4 [Glycine max]KAH1140459.1 hypothetical protein GYH30_029381 [Glycine max]
MGRTATFCSTLFLLLSSRFRFLPFLDIFLGCRVTSAKLVVLSMSLPRHIYDYNMIYFFN